MGYSKKNTTNIICHISNKLAIYSVTRHHFDCEKNRAFCSGILNLFYITQTTESIKKNPKTYLQDRQ